MRKKAAGILKAVWTIVISVALISAGLMCLSLQKQVTWLLILLGIWCRISHLVIPLRIWDSVDKSINIMGERGNTPPGQAGEHEDYGKNGLRYGSHVYDRFL